MRVWRRLGPLLAVVLVLNLFSMVAAPGSGTAQERPALTYYALGDSYASGHGLQGSDPQDDKGACRRSSLAYPYQVQKALSETYTVDFGPDHHLACSGATAGPNPMDPADEGWDPAKSISHQFERVNDELEERDRAGGTDPVLITITIGANDVGLDRLSTWLKVLRSFPTLQLAR